jgi:hypothetical protein
MEVIHFTEGATDPMKAFGAKNGRYVPLADGIGTSHISCMHLEKGASIPKPMTSSAAALLVVHGRIVLFHHQLMSRNQIHAGMGVVLDEEEPYAIKAETHAIVLVVEADLLWSHPDGTSTPERISGQTWPSDAVISG